MNQQAWDQIKSLIKRDMSETKYTMWIRPIKYVESTPKTLSLVCANHFSRRWVADNYLDILHDKIQQFTGIKRDIIFTTMPLSIKRDLPITPLPVQLTLPDMDKPELQLNPAFSFDRFITGAANEFAFSAAEAMAVSRTAWDYQSLLILATTGLGKSHLAQAIAQQSGVLNPHARIIYVTAENYTNDMVTAIRSNHTTEFKDKYRHCDILLIEEIHFLANKMKTQSELCFTLDELSNQKKPVLFTSPIPPEDIPGISKDLSSRISGSLTTTIKEPDYETRIKMFRAKMREHDLNLTDEMVEVLARLISGDVRRIEAALKLIKARRDLSSETITIDLVQEVAASITTDDHESSLTEIEKLVCAYYKIDPEIMRSKSRRKEHVLPRNIYIWLCRHHTNKTLANIAETVGRNHSSVLYASETIETTMDRNPAIKRQVKFLSERLQVN